MTLTMIDLRRKKGTRISDLCRLGVRLGGFLFLANLAGCASLPFPAFDLSPAYKAPEVVVPDSWEGTSSFVKAKPSDDALRPDWWRLYNDPILNNLVEQAIAANPDLQATAERFVQARNSMMKARSRYFPQIGFGFGGNNNRQSDNTLFRAPGEPNSDTQVEMDGLASWEPDFWSKLRNAAQAKIYLAEERAADYGLARLILQAEVASNYFTLRGLDAQIAIYEQSIGLYNYSLDVVVTQFEGAIASNLDVARAKSLLYATESKLALMHSERKVTEQAIAILLNLAPASFKLEPVDNLLVANSGFHRRCHLLYLSVGPMLPQWSAGWHRPTAPLELHVPLFFQMWPSGSEEDLRIPDSICSAWLTVSGPMVRLFPFRFSRADIVGLNCNNRGRSIARRKIHIVRQC